MRYRYDMTGTAARGQSWKTNGYVHSNDGLGPLSGGGAMVFAMRQSFEQLTRGEAVFGKPGEGCEGPYHVIRFMIEEAPEA